MYHLWMIDFLINITIQLSIFAKQGCHVLHTCYNLVTFWVNCDQLQVSWTITSRAHWAYSAIAVVTGYSPYQSLGYLSYNIHFGWLHHMFLMKTGRSLAYIFWHTIIMRQLGEKAPCIKLFLLPFWLGEVFLILSIQMFWLDGHCHLIVVPCRKTLWSI